MSNATLGFQIDSSQASSAAADLDKLTAAAARTQQAADKLQAEAGGLGTALGAAGAGAGKALPAVDSLGKKLVEQDDQVRAFRMEVERLTLKYQPLARATQSYEASVSEINRAHQLGVINAQQMQKALDAERLSFERLKTSATAAGAAVKAANSNGGGGQSFNAANAGYQFQDVAVTAAMGMSPLMIGLQQGTQLASVVSSMERPVAGLATAFASLLSPVSLITIGLTAGAAALIQYFTAADEGTGKTSKLFQEQNDIIRKAAELWGDATPSLRAYVDELDRADKITSGKEAGEILAGRELEGLSENLDSIKREATEAFRALRGDAGNDVVVRDLRNAWSELRTGLDDGTASMADLNAVQQQLSTAIAQYGVPEVLKFKDAFDQNTDSIYRSIEAANKARTAYISAIAGGTNVQDIVAGSSFTDQGKIYRPSDFMPANAPRPQSRPLLELEGDGSKAGPATITNSDGLLVNVPVPGRKPNFFEMEETKEKVDDLEKAYRKAQEAKADFWLDVGFQERQSERSAIDQRIATTLNRYGFDENMQSNEANTLRQQYQREEQKTFIKGFFSDMYTEAWANGGNIGKAIAKSALNAAQEAMGKAWDSLFEKLASGISSLLFGGSGATSSLTSSGGGLLAAAASGLAANDNTAKLTSVTRSPLADIPTTDIAKYIANAASARGIDPSIALKVAKSEGGLNSWNMQSTFMKNGVQEPSFGPYQLYMGGGLGNAFQKKTGLDPRLAANGPAGVDFALDNAKQSGWGAWYGAKKVGVGNWDGIGKGGANGAADAVSKLAESAGAATTGLDTLGSGLGKIGQSLSSSFFPAAPSAAGGGGGAFSWLTSLFGGGGKPSKSGVPMYANGINYAAGGLSIVGEQGIELVDLPQGARVHSNNKSQQMLGMMANGNEPRGASNLNVNIVGASGDNHVRMLVQQGVAAALAAQDDQDRRGGFGARQARYSSQKG